MTWADDVDSMRLVILVGLGPVTQGLRPKAFGSEPLAQGLWLRVCGLGPVAQGLCILGCPQLDNSCFCYTMHNHRNEQSLSNIIN